MEHDTHQGVGEADQRLLFFLAFLCEARPRDCLVWFGFGTVESDVKDITGFTGKSVTRHGSEPCQALSQVLVAWSAMRGGKSEMYTYGTLRKYSFT